MMIRKILYLTMCLCLLPVLAGAEGHDIYRLGPADVLKLSVFGEDDLSGELRVDADGFVSVPLAGKVQIGSLTLPEAENVISDALMDGYLKHPQLSLEIAVYRPFYMIGEVRQPGQYGFTDGITFLNAVAISGGFTYRANQKEVLVMRKSHGSEEFEPMPLNHDVLPGDIVKVKERFF